jgi:ubiquinol oxidase
MMEYFKDKEGAVQAKRKNMNPKLKRKLESLTCSSKAIWKREESRPEVKAPWILKAPYFVLCALLDNLFTDDMPIQRFWFLETVARMPYFSYTSMLTFYEILGWWRRSSELRKIHFAEEWNEYHHLLIMESLGGDASWRDRFLGQHAAIVYYFALVIVWLISPALAYNFSELIEAHAVDTYATFVDENEAVLKTMPPPRIAKEYYEAADLYLFDEFQTDRDPRTRRPKIDSMYDVFCNIRDDEGEHVSTMNACQREDSIIASPNGVNAKTAAIGAIITAQIWFNHLAQTAVESEVVDVDALVDSAFASDAGSSIIDAILRLLSAGL